MERLKTRLYEGMAERGITGAVADEIFVKMAAFANYGFPESHSVSFSYLVYSSSWIKYHEPAAFCAALLNAQPMGFWSPHSLVQDARRHGVVVHTPDLNASLATATLEPCEESVGGVAVRLGIGSVRGIGAELAAEIQAGRPYTSVEHLVRRVPQLTADPARGDGHRRCVHRVLRQRSTYGVVGGWRRGAVALIGCRASSPAVAPQLPGMDEVETRWPTCGPLGVAPTGHPTRFLRDELRRRGVLTSDELQTAEPRSRVTIAGVVTHRQRPMTTQGTAFMNLEDETGLMNVVISRAVGPVTGVARVRRCSSVAGWSAARGCGERGGRAARAPARPASTASAATSADPSTSGPPECERVHRCHPPTRGLREPRVPVPLGCPTAAHEAAGYGRSIARPFRFAVQVAPFDDAEALPRSPATSRRSATRSCTATTTSAVDPFVPLMVAAGATERLCVGPLVLNNEFHQPVLLASHRSDGRPVGGRTARARVGHRVHAERTRRIGLELRAPGPRVTRFGESPEVVRSLLDRRGLVPRRAPPRRTTAALGVRPPPSTCRSLIGGHGRRVVSLAARYADIFQYTGLHHGEGGGAERRWFGIEHVVERSRWLTGRRTSRPRDSAIERSILVQHTHVGDGAEAALDAAVERFGMDRNCWRPPRSC
jgi:hypothetical protein